jgi:hypothetical protein
LASITRARLGVARKVPGDRLVPVFGPDGEHADRQGQQIGELDATGVDGLGQLRVRDRRRADLGHAVAGEDEGVESREGQAGDDDGQAHAPPHPGGEELTELGTDGEAHQIDPPS